MYKGFRERKASCQQSQIFKEIRYVRTSRKNNREKKPYGGNRSLTKTKQPCAHIPFCGQPTRSYPDAEIKVYNRWGQLIFESSENYFGNEWDGTHKGEPLPFAVYYFTIDPISEYGKTYHGGVTIKR